MTAIYFVNVFKSENVYLQYMEQSQKWSEKIKLHKHSSIPLIFDKGQYYYKYIVDDIDTYYENSLIYFHNDGRSIYNYFIINSDNKLDKNFMLCAKNDINIIYSLAEIEKSIDKKIKYIKIAAEKDHPIAIEKLKDYNYPLDMYNLGIYYKNAKNYSEMKKHYLLAIEKKYAPAMYALGYYYQTIKKNYKLMKLYYKMAIKNNDIKSMIALSEYYDKIAKKSKNDTKFINDYTYRDSFIKKYKIHKYDTKKQSVNNHKMKHYLHLAAKKGSIAAMYKLIDYYNSYAYSKSSYDQEYMSNEYYRMAADAGCLDALYNLIDNECSTGHIDYDIVIEYVKELYDAAKATKAAKTAKTAKVTKTA